MHTTPAIDDDVLAAAKGLAARQHKSVGEVVSDLIQQALQPQNALSRSARNGVPLLPVRAGSMPVTPELVNQLRDELPAVILRSARPTRFTCI
jgi:hypothetical protein